ncbi:capsular polysaccharide biosynthesis protein [Pullulanibacillus pueri]|uniref:Uncharacterized protein n=1 Tax=Pullulanibacillus pueri TaxID=1437324 RepID=A0A8J3EM71_9BACL|nr:hypothetical protein [Pullulanibacillus pueri]MBM7680631.1 capsular polysaccharide biosynthesis protein [Pullulanibacillus pueri]GGH83887.1 hypothetical protein GCM10007096_25690 [Pullulanibacillus pueri]
MADQESRKKHKPDIHTVVKRELRFSLLFTVMVTLIMLLLRFFVFKP